MSNLPDSTDRVIEMSTVGRSLVPTDPGGVSFFILLTSEMLVNLRMVVIKYNPIIYPYDFNVSSFQYSWCTLNNYHGLINDSYYFHKSKYMQFMFTFFLRRIKSHEAWFFYPPLIPVYTWDCFYINTYSCKVNPFMWVTSFLNPNNSSPVVKLKKSQVSVLPFSI